jgi:hypothetical protein
VKGFGLALALGAALFLSAAPASAATIGVTYSGKVTSVEAGGGAQFAIGDTFTFNFLIDDTTPDSQPMPGIGIYYDAITSFTGSFSNGFHFTMDQASSGDDQVGVGNAATDGVFITTSTFLAPKVDAKQLVYLSLSFYDPTGTMLNSEAIPTDLASLLAYTAPSPLMMQFGADGQFFKVQGEILSAATPIPAALPLLMSAIGGLAFVGWRRRRLA